MLLMRPFHDTRFWYHALTTSRGSLRSLIFFFSPTPVFFSFPPQCGACSQAIQDEQYKTSTHYTGYVYAWVG